jgi:hypothetical protein
MLMFSEYTILEPLEETLHPEACGILSKIVHEKTMGNPFLVNHSADI